MIKLDEKDRKILVELDKNARATDSEIAKKVRLSKQVTRYRIKNLIKKEVINNFYTVVNVGKLGFSTYYVFLQLESTSEKEEKELLGKIKNKPYVGWLISGTGRWDVIILIYARSTSEFDKHLTEVLEVCKNRVHEYSFTNLITAEHMGYKFLGQKNILSALQTEKKQAIHLNEKSKKILKTISQNARLTTVEIAEKTNLPLHVVRYDLKELIKKEVIEAFKPKLDVNKLGYQWHLLLVQFTPVKEERRKELVNFCRSNKKVYYVTQTIGAYNLMLDIHVKNTEEFKKTLFEIKEKFPDVIKLYESIIIFDEYKIDYFTDLFA